MRARWLLLFVLVVSLIGSVGLGGRAQAAAPAPQVPATCEDGVLASGALYFICVPTFNWTGDVVIWNHGYVAPQLPVDFATTGTLYLTDGTYLPDIVLGLGYAFAATTYRSNGLAALDAVADVNLLLEKYRELHDPDEESLVYLTGASMGGLVTAMLAEHYPDSYAGALAACGVVGDFRRQINYWGDFRVLFDYFFPGVLPGSPIDIPQALIDNWDAYQLAIVGAVQANPAAARQLLAAAKAPIDPANPEESTLTTVISLLWYNVFATNEGKVRLGGNPYGNLGRIYWGSDDDRALNRGVQRFVASPRAVAAMRQYETSGRVRVPMILPHTTRDQIVRIDQSLIYWLKARPTGDGSVLPIPIPRYGHCTFTPEELVFSFGLLVAQVTGEFPQMVGAQAAVLSLPGIEAELAAQAAAFRAREAADAARQAPAAATRVFLPLLSR